MVPFSAFTGALLILLVAATNAQLSFSDIAAKHGLSRPDQSTTDGLSNLKPKSEPAVVKPQATQSPPSSPSKQPQSQSPLAQLQQQPQAQQPSPLAQLQQPPQAQQQSQLSHQPQQHAQPNGQYSPNQQYTSPYQTPYNQYGQNPYQPYGQTPYQPYGQTPYQPYGQQQPYQPYGQSPYHPYNSNPYGQYPQPNPYQQNPYYQPNPYQSNPYQPYGQAPYQPYGQNPYQPYGQNPYNSNPYGPPQPNPNQTPDPFPRYRPGCSISCPQNIDPVCGINEDGTTREFNNECAYNGDLRCNMDSKLKRFVKGSCKDLSASDKAGQQNTPQPQPKPQPNRSPRYRPGCSTTCMQNVDPVCGINEDGTTRDFYNQCAYNVEASCNMDSKLKRVVKGSCKDLSVSDRTGHQNTPQPQPKPEPSPRYMPGCSMSCPQYIDPVCGINEDGTTRDFNNECAYNADLRCNMDSKLRRFVQGSCAMAENLPTPNPQPKPQPQPNPSPRYMPGCSTSCPQNVDPVCGINADGSERNFSNECAYNADRRCNMDSKLKRFVKGSCKDLSEADKVEKPAPPPLHPQGQAGQAQQSGHYQGNSSPSQQTQRPTQQIQRPTQQQQSGQQGQPGQCVPMMCPQNYDPVCAVAADGTTRSFSNKCVYDSHVMCNPRSFTQASPGECHKPNQYQPPPQQNQPQMPPGQCVPLMCQQNYDPVCAVAADGTTRTFSNKCAYDSHVICYPKSFTRASPGECHKPNQHQSSPQQNQPQMPAGQCEALMCSQNYDPVCAVAADGTTRTFGNKCSYDSHVICNPRSFTRATPGECHKLNQHQSSPQQCAPMVCPLNYDPLCAVTGNGTMREFSNSCSYESHLKCHPRSFLHSTKGECPKGGQSVGIGHGEHRPSVQPNQSPQQCEPMMCAQNYDPVCAFAPDGTTRQFSNGCSYDSHVKCAPGSFSHSVKGTCPRTEQPYGNGHNQNRPSVQPNDPPQQCENSLMCAQNYDPVCAYAADGTTRQFANGCDYDSHVICAPGSFTRSVKGPCPITEQHSQYRPSVQSHQTNNQQPPSRAQQPQPQPCEQMMCAQNYDPVCGVAPDGTTKQFSNGCSYDSHVKCAPGSYVSVTRGECPRAPEPTENEANEAQQQHQGQISYPQQQQHEPQASYPQQQHQGQISYPQQQHEPQASYPQQEYQQHGSYPQQQDKPQASNPQQEYQQHGSYPQQQDEPQASYPQQEYQPHGSYIQQQHEPQASYPQQKYQPHGSYPQQQHEPQASYPQEEYQQHGSYPQQQDEPQANYPQQQDEPQANYPQQQQQYQSQNSYPEQQMDYQQELNY